MMTEVLENLYVQTERIKADVQELKQDQLQQRIRQTVGLDLGAVSARNPAKVRLTLGQWFQFLLAHERRHLWQARNVAGDPRFPR